MLEIKVVEVRGSCPVHKVGDKIVIDDPRMVLEKTDACMQPVPVLPEEGRETVRVMEMGVDNLQEKNL